MELLWDASALFVLVDIPLMVKRLRSSEIASSGMLMVRMAPVKYIVVLPKALIPFGYSLPTCCQ